nr:SRPBCC family protein [Methylobacterium crusticola]
MPGEGAGRRFATASASVTLPAPADRVWALIGGFGSLPDWLPFIRESSLAEGGRTRHLRDVDGHPIVERLTSFDERGRRYGYHILQAPFPVTDYDATLRVSDAGDGRARVEWSGRFIPAGVGDAEAVRVFQAIFEDGLKALAARFAG